MSGKIWFITGTSKGFGRVWAEAALARGDKVAATARDVNTLAPLVARYGAVAFRKGNVPGDPQATGAAILKFVDAEQPPLRIFFGSGGLPLTRAEYARRIEIWEKWNDVSVEAQGDWAAKQRR